MKAETFELDLEEEPRKSELAPSPGSAPPAKYKLSEQGPNAPAPLPPNRRHAPRLIAEDPEKRRIVGRVAAPVAKRGPSDAALAAEQSLTESPTSVQPEPPPPPPFFEGGGLNEVGTLRNVQRDEDDEFSYAFEDGKREEGFHKQVFRPKAMPAHLVSNVKQPLNTEVLEEEDEEEEDEEEEDEEDEDEDKLEEGPAVTAFAERVAPFAGAEDGKQPDEDDRSRSRSRASDAPSRCSNSASYTPTSTSKRPDGGFGGANALLGSGASGLASGLRSGSSSHTTTGTGGGAGKAAQMRLIADANGSAPGGNSERSRSGGEDLDIMRLSTGPKDAKHASWTTFAVSEGPMDSIVDDGATAQASPGTPGPKPGDNAAQDPAPAAEDLPSYKLMQALHVAGHAGGAGGSTGVTGTTGGTGFLVEQALAVVPDTPCGVSQGPAGSDVHTSVSFKGLDRSRQSEEQHSTLHGMPAVGAGAAAAAGEAAPGAAAAPAPPSGGVLAPSPKSRPLSVKPVAAEDEWDAANRERQREMGGSAQASPSGARTPVLTYHTALVHFMAMDTSAFRITVAVALPPPPSLFARMLCLGPPTLHPPLLTEQLLQLLSLARLSFNDEDAMHVRLLGSLYAAYTGRSHDPPRYGSHWADLGFQGQDPATDLRGCGMLGLLQLYYLTQWSAASADKVYRLSRHPVQEFPLAIVSLNMTKWTLQALRAGLLHRAANTRGSVVEAAQQFYAGCMATFYKTWLGGRKTMAHSGHVLKELEALSMKKPSLILAAAQAPELPNPPEPGTGQ